MAKKTNKTSHVLNLITGGGAEAETENPQTSLSVQESVSVQPRESLQADQKVVVVDPGQDEQIAEDIRKGLLSEIGEEMEDPVPVVEEWENDDTPEEDEETLKAEVSETAEAENLEMPTEAPETSGEAPSTPRAEEADLAEPMYRMVNVMEEILSPDVIRREMEKYGVCMCSRCQADVLALLLTRLPSKYIVANTPAIPPLLSYYRSKYRVNLLTQAIKACLEVKEHPRHDRKEHYAPEEYVDN